MQARERERKVRKKSEALALNDDESLHFGFSHANKTGMSICITISMRAKL